MLYLRSHCSASCRPILVVVITRAVNCKFRYFKLHLFKSPDQTQPEPNRQMDGSDPFSSYFVLYRLSLTFS